MAIPKLLNSVNTWSIELDRVNLIFFVVDLMGHEKIIIIKYIYQVLGRPAEFQESIIAGNAAGTFIDFNANGVLVPTQVPNIEPVLDDPDRWTSTYLMIEQARALRQVCNHYCLPLSTDLYA